MDVANWVQYFNEVVAEAHRRIVGVIKPDGGLDFINQGTPTADYVDWTWVVCKRVPEDVVAGFGLTLKPDSLGLGFEFILTVFAHKGEERLGETNQTYWARFVDLEYPKYDSGRFKKELAEEIAFQLRRACEHVIMVAPRLGEISANRERIKAEMRVLNFTLHRAK